ncbi:MAG: hypothetical protein ACRDLB_09680 [Actinomycetota bacterium]
MSKLRNVHKPGALVGALFVAASIFVIGGQATASHEPADKVSAAGSSTEIVPAGSQTVILSEEVKTANPTDLILGVTAECSITTDVTTVGSQTQSAEGTLRFWVEVDGIPVPVSQEDTDAGRVVFCNRLYERTTSLGADDEQDSIRTFMRTRNANGFNWMALNVGHGIHTIEVKAELITASTMPSTATGVIGNRTLIVEPVKSANDEVVTEF